MSNEDHKFIDKFSGKKVAAGKGSVENQEKEHLSESY